MERKSRSLTLPITMGQDQDRPARDSTHADFDCLLLRRLLKSVGSPDLTIELWDGRQVSSGKPIAQSKLKIKNRTSLLRLLINPELQFGELYSKGDLEVVGDLTAFLETVYRSLHKRSASRFGRTLPLRRFHRGNSLSGSRHNIHHHYDIGNEFYSLWLDTAAMQYTCAYFPEAALPLEQAQLAKMDHVCRKLRLKAGETVVEAGSGWGGLARFMAKRYGVRVTAYNISHEQVIHARKQAHAEGLDDRVVYIEDDYRNIRGCFDAFVSVGMLEHVGPDHYHHLGSTIDRCLAASGRGLIHSIGRNRPRPMNTWIEKRIFPGAYPPSLGEMMNIFEPWAFSVLDVENLRLHYAKTLRHWTSRFDLVEDQVRQMFDARFVRMWRLYLAGSAAAFSTGELQLFQVAFSRPQNNSLPWNRDHLVQKTRID